jgi:type I restriction enzyme S subunit
MMLDQQQRYDHYIDSGVDWIGHIPSSWSVLRNGTLFQQMNDAGNEHLPVLSVSIHSGVSKEELSEEENIRSAIKIADRSSYKEVKPGYVAYNMMRAWQGGIGFVSTHGMVSPAYVVAKPTSEINSAYFEYLYRTDLFIGQMDRYSKGITDFRKRLYWEEFKTLLTVVPPLPDQDRIVSFLDEKTAEIDAAIAKKRRLIDLLNEQKAILINRAVTKGLNPDAPMKDSGVDWIGEIPAHWEVKRVKFLTNLKSGETITSDAFVEQGFPVYGGNGFRGFASTSTHEGDYVLIGRQGALCGNINYASGKFFASEHAIVASPKTRLWTHWLGEVLRVANLGLLSQSAAQPGISVEAVGNVFVPKPPLDEQEQLATLFRTSDKAYSEVVSHVENEISTLNEFKQTLIGNAVTGKIKI